MKTSHSKILIVDDTQENLHNLLNCMFEGGYLNILCAKNGKDAIELAKSELPDLILLDWDMPGISGIEVLERVKANIQTSLIPVIITTGAMLSANNLEQALSKGAVDYIRKPFESIELLARVKSALDFSSMLGTIQNQYQKIISQKNSLERNEKRIKALLDASVEACILVKKDIIIEANKVFFNCTGFTPEEVIQHSFQSFLDESSRIIFAERSMDFGQSFSLSLRTREGDILPVEILTKQIDYNQQLVLAISLINLNQFNHLFEEKQISELMVQKRKINELTEQIKRQFEENQDLLKQLQLKDLQQASYSEFMGMLSGKLDELTCLISDEPEFCEKELRLNINSIKQHVKPGQWNDFRIRFAQLHPGFYDHLLQDFPSLTEKDLRLCSLIKLNLSTKEMARISSVLPNTIKVARKRLRAKLNLEKTSESLIHMLSRY